MAEGCSFAKCWSKVSGLQGPFPQFKGHCLLYVAMYKIMYLAEFSLRILQVTPSKWFRKAIRYEVRSGMVKRSSCEGSGLDLAEVDAPS